MKAVVINEDGTVSVQHTEKPKITSPEQILVKIAYSGLCGSDIPRIFHHGAHYYPITLGHEFSGHVVELGHDVTEFAVGDLISCIPLLPCFGVKHACNIIIRSVKTTPLSAHESAAALLNILC